MIKLDIFLFFFKVAATVIRHFARIKFSNNLVYKKYFSSILQAVFKVGCIFCQRGRIPLLSLNGLEEKSRVTIIHGKFVSKP